MAEFAEIAGKTDARVYQWVQAGMPHRKRKARGTRIVPREAIAWLLERAKKEASPKETDASSPFARKLLAEAELKELELEERRGALVALDTLNTFCDALVGGFAAVAAGRLQRFEREIVVTATPAAARKLTEQIHHALMAGAQEYAEELEGKAVDLEEGATPPATTAEPDAGP